MKKFGTPIGAGPGNANEKVGFDAEGAPCERRRGFGLEAFRGVAGRRVRLLPCRFPVPWFLWLLERLCCGFEPEDFDCPPWLCEVGCFAVAGPVACGSGCERGVEDGPLGAVVRVVLVKVVLVRVVEGQDSDTAKIGGLTGSDNADNGVPAGTFTVKVSFCPPATVTVTRH